MKPRPVPAITLGLALLAALALGTVVANGFVTLDDRVYLTENPVVGEGLTAHGVAWAFRTSRAANWHPVTWLSHMLDVQLFGLRPGWHHLVSLLLHTASALLLFGLLRSLTGALWRPALVAALFAVHPLHVESVAWASERKDVLSILLMLLALAAHLAWLRRGGAGRRAATGLLFALSLMAKPTPVTFPFLLLLLDWWPLGRWAPRRVPGAPLAGLLPPLRLWAEKIPLFLLAVASSAITVHVQAREGALVGTGSLPMPVRAANAAISYVRYLGKTVLPTDLSAFYPHPSLLPPWWQWAGAILLLAAVSLLAARTARSRPWLAVGWLWYLGTLVPMIGLVQVGGQAMADRYAYLPIAGLFIAAAWEAARAVCGRRTAPTAALAAAVVLLAAGASARQAALWRDTTTLFRHALAVTPPARPGAPPNPTLAMLHNSLGVALAGEGRLAEAIEQYRLALAANPDFGESLNNLGRALEDQGRPDEAAPLYERARESDRLNGEARSNLGLVMLARGRFADAAALFRETLAIDPVHWTATNNLPVALASLGRAGEADAAFRRAVALDPRYPVGRMNYGRFLLAQGRPGEAELQLREALRLEPGLAPAHALLGDALARLGRSAEARASFRQALALAPGLWEARIGLELLERGPAPGR